MKLKKDKYYCSHDTILNVSFVLQKNKINKCTLNIKLVNFLHSTVFKMVNNPSN